MPRFTKGQSGNPGGRPKEVADIKALAREYSGVAVKTLVDMCVDAKANSYARVSAANSILAYGFGKPTQAVEHSGQIDTGIAALLAAIDGKTRGLPNKK